MLLGYARVSTDGQDHALQLDALRQAGCGRTFTETASGTRSDGPRLAEAVEFAWPGDTLVVWRLDRLARSLRHLIDLTEGLNRHGVGLRSLTEAIDTQSVSGRFVSTELAALGEMEVQLLRERTRAGLRAAAARGRVGGRPRALDETKLRVAQTLFADGALSAAEIARQVGCAPSTLYRSLPGGRRATVRATIAGTVGAMVSTTMPATISSTVAPTMPGTVGPTMPATGGRSSEDVGRMRREAAFSGGA